jgi:hypothetical protein
MDVSYREAYRTTRAGPRRRPAPRSPAGNPSCGHATGNRRSRNPLIFKGGIVVAFATEWLFGRAPSPDIGTWFVWREMGCLTSVTGIQ